MAMTWCIATTKGGAGKSTLTALMAGEFAHAGMSVIIADADPQQTLVKWEARCIAAGTKHADINVINANNSKSLKEIISRSYEGDGVLLIDVQGAASDIMTVAALNSDMVIVPCIPSEFDVAEAGKVPDFLAQMARVGETPTPYKIVINAVDGLEEKRATFRRSVIELMQRGYEPTNTFIMRRDYYRQIAAGIGSLYSIPAKKKDEGLQKAILNIRDLVSELVDFMKSVNASKKGKA